MNRVFLVSMLMWVFLAAPASADVYKCAEPDGRVTYTNDPTAARRCKALDTQLPVSTLPSAPTLQLNRPVTAQPGPADFPRVTPDAQRTRDGARRQILEQELLSEQTALERITLEMQAAQDDEESLSALTHRHVLHERNIAAIQREISLLR